MIRITIEPEALERLKSYEPPNQEEITETDSRIIFAGEPNERPMFDGDAIQRPEGFETMQAEFKRIADEMCRADFEQRQREIADANGWKVF